MKRRVFLATTDTVVAHAAYGTAQAAGLHPETYLRTENVERLQLTVYIIMCDSVVAATHGKNELPALPVVE